MQCWDRKRFKAIPQNTERDGVSIIRLKMITIIIPDATSACISILPAYEIPIKKNLKQKYAHTITPQRHVHRITGITHFKDKSHESRLLRHRLLYTTATAGGGKPNAKETSRNDDLLRNSFRKKSCPLADSKSKLRLRSADEKAKQKEGHQPQSAKQK